jgi:hypothetical protein
MKKVKCKCCGKKFNPIIDVPASAVQQADGSIVVFSAIAQCPDCAVEVEIKNSIVIG